MKYLISLIEEVDLFSQSVVLHFNNQKKFPTVLGGLLTLTIYCLIMALLISLGQDLIYRNKPIANLVNLFSPIAPTLKVNDESLPFVFQILGNDLLPIQIDNSYFQFEINQFVVDRRGEPKIDNFSI